MSKHFRLDIYYGIWPVLIWSFTGKYQFWQGLLNWLLNLIYHSVVKSRAPFLKKFVFAKKQQGHHPHIKDTREFLLDLEVSAVVSC